MAAGRIWSVTQVTDSLRTGKMSKNETETSTFTIILGAAVYVLGGRVMQRRSDVFARYLTVDLNATRRSKIS